MGKWRRHSREFKQQAVERMKGCDNVQELARELGVERKLLYSWKYQFEGRPEPKHANYLGRAAPQTAETRLRAENQALKLTLGEKAAEADFFAAALRRVKQEMPSTGGNGAPASTPKSLRKPKRKAR
jgi:transposase-like protein